MTYMRILVLFSLFVVWGSEGIWSTSIKTHDSDHVLLVEVVKIKYGEIGNHGQGFDPTQNVVFTAKVLETFKGGLVKGGLIEINAWSTTFNSRGMPTLAPSAGFICLGDEVGVTHLAFMDDYESNYKVARNMNQYFERACCDLGYVEADGQNADVVLLKDKISIINEAVREAN